MMVDVCNFHNILNIYDVFNVPPKRDVDDATGIRYGVPEVIVGRHGRDVIVTNVVSVMFSMFAVSCLLGP
jgi:hypothetical protein